MVDGKLPADMDVSGVPLITHVCLSALDLSSSSALSTHDRISHALAGAISQAKLAVAHVQPMYSMREHSYGSVKRSSTLDDSYPQYWTSK